MPRSSAPAFQRDAFSPAAQQRLQQPLRRGQFRPLDAARAERALLSVADGQGQGRISWLVDLAGHIIADARFLAFGHLASHPLLDAWSDAVKGKTLDEACAISADDLERGLRSQDDQPAFGIELGQAGAFIADLQARVQATTPTLKVLPKPVEVERYQRKREQDWDDNDQAWLPLSLMKKIGQLQAKGDHTLSDRLGMGQVAWSIEGLHDDFRVVVDLSKAASSDEITVLPSGQHETALMFLQSAFREIHPALHVHTTEAPNP